MDFLHPAGSRGRLGRPKPNDMAKTPGPFRFKQFEASHTRSAMRIGVDGVLTGAWCTCQGAATILDAGTGCGLIALMCAQRTSEALVLAVDTDPASIEEARGNFEASPWASRLKAIRFDFNCLDKTTVTDWISPYHVNPAGAPAGLDLIVSNPPYFDSGVKGHGSPRLNARHQGAFNPHALLTVGTPLLSPSGRIALIIPSDQTESLMDTACASRLTLLRHTAIRGHEGVPCKRSLLEFGKSGYTWPPQADSLITLTEEDGSPTQAHRDLCREFYLHF